MTLNTDYVTRVETGTTAAELNTIIAQAEKGTTILLGEGTHRFTESVIINRSDVTLRGEKEETTTIIFDFPKNEGTNGIQVLAGQKNLVGMTTEDIVVNQTQLTMADTSGIKAGDTLLVAQHNDAEIINNPLYSNVSAENFQRFDFKEGMAQVERVEGNTVYLKHAIAHEMDAGKTEVYLMDVLTNVQLSDMTITYDLGKAGKYNFDNTLKDFANTAAVHLKGTNDAVLQNISILNAASTGFDIRNSIELNADNLLVDGSHNKGKEGNGYGVQLYESFHNNFSNLELFDTRHAFLLSAWHSEAYNSVQIKEMNRDLNFHGGMDKFNEFIIDRVTQEYKPELNQGPEKGIWSLVSEGGINHPVTNIYGDNVVKFDSAVAGKKNDIFYGTEAGNKLHGKSGHDFIAGHGGDDTLMGGSGKDTLMGGEGKDTLDGGNNADWLDGGEGNDVIRAGLGADQLIGGEGNDKLYGSGGTDTLMGGAGRDYLSGGTGADTFVFLAIKDSSKIDKSYDVISDFRVGSDILDLSALDFTGLDTDGGKTELGELKMTYSAALDRTYLRSDQSDFQLILEGDYMTKLTDNDFLF
jgi:Ca2+-binding RTX toxin-like protein